MRETFAARLKECLLRLKLTQAQFAQLIGVAPGTLSAYLKQDKVPTLEKAAEIASKLNVSIAWLCGENEWYQEGLFHKGHTNYAAVIRVINELNDIPWHETFLLESQPVPSRFNHKEYPGLTITISDPTIGRFYKDYQKVRELYETKVIDREMHDAWIEKRLRELENEPLELMGQAVNLK